MGRLIDLFGQRFGRLVVTGRAENDSNGHARWACKCDCGTESHVVMGDNLKRGQVASCGCARLEANTKHNLSRLPIYNTWRQMIQRCENPKNTNYPRYGGKGVGVCGRWHDFECFHADMGDRPEGMSLDRIDPHGDYSPENCQWAGRQEQGANKRQAKPVRLLSPEGDRVVVRRGYLRRFCAEYGLDSGCISRVLSGKSKQHKGWTGKYL